MVAFLTKLVVNNNNEKIEFARNLSDNIVRPLNILATFPLTTDEMSGDYCL